MITVDSVSSKIIVGDNVRSLDVQRIIEKYHEKKIGKLVRLEYREKRGKVSSVELKKFNGGIGNTNFLNSQLHAFVEDLNKIVKVECIDLTLSDGSAYNVDEQGDVLTRH